jgi:hypothetical protein
MFGEETHFDYYIKLTLKLLTAELTEAKKMQGNPI